MLFHITVDTYLKCDGGRYYYDRVIENNGAA